MPLLLGLSTNQKSRNRHSFYLSTVLRATPPPPLPFLSFLHLCLIIPLTPSPFSVVNPSLKVKEAIWIKCFTGRYCALVNKVNLFLAKWRRYISIGVFSKLEANSRLFLFCSIFVLSFYNDFIPPFSVLKNQFIFLILSLFLLCSNFLCFYLRIAKQLSIFIYLLQCWKVILVQDCFCTRFNQKSLTFFNVVKSF